jgi:alpha-L-rhamnosidase
MSALKPKWIWHFGDFEIYHSMLLHARRQEKGHDYPAMWHTDTPYATVEFYKTFECEKEGWIRGVTNGVGYLSMDGNMLPTGVRHTVPAGSHHLVFRVTKTDGLPCAFVEGDVCVSDDSWLAGHMDIKRYPACATPAFEDENVTPETFPFQYEPISPISVESIQQGELYDFGRERFGIVRLKNADPAARIGVYYGESREEALDHEHTLVRDSLTGKGEYLLPARAFRYIHLSPAPSGLVLEAEYEYLPLEYKGKFACEDELLNKVYDTAAYTFHLNSREFFLDGIKRDRWVWSGDAFQSYMVNNYLFFDQELTRRTIIALRGKDPVEQHINTILDYSLYWIISLKNYYMSFGDLKFVELMFDKAKTLLDYCESKVDENGFLIGKEGDWVFVDWSEIDKEGAVCAEQMLYVHTLRVMAELSALLNRDGAAYAKKAEEMARKVDEFYWDEEKGGYIDSYVSGKRSVTRHANIFAVMFDIADSARQQRILNCVLLNDQVTQITTPYFKFFELDVMCKLGQLDSTTRLMRDYWGGMIRLGATSIWELYDPTESGVQHYAMYGSRYGKSLCHAWGGGPIYLLGRYYLGVCPTSPAYETFEVAPQLGGLERIQGVVPTPNGTVSVEADARRVRVTASCPGGTLSWNGQKIALPAGETVEIES